MLKEHSKLRESNLSASDAGYAAKTESDNEALKAQIAAFTASVAALSTKPAATTAPPNPPGQGQRGGRGGGRTQGRGRGRGRDQPTVYCFEHGYKGHWGTACRNMAADPSYTKAMTASSSLTALVSLTASLATIDGIGLQLVPYIIRTIIIIIIIIMPIILQPTT